jgi:hypothetical protein
MFAFFKAYIISRWSMPKQTLSVELDASLVERVQRYSEQHGQELSQTVGELIEQLPTNGSAVNRDIRPARRSYGTEAPGGGAAWEAELSPAVRMLLGAGAGPADEEDYRGYLMEKYGP